MKSLIRWGLAGAAAVALLVPGRASAQLLNGSFTGGSNFATTMDVVLSYNGTGSFTLTLTNNGVYDEVYTRIGLINLPEGTDMTGFAVASDPDETRWKFDEDIGGDGLTGDGLPDYIEKYLALASPVMNGLMVGETETFSFFLANWADYSAAELALVGVGVHAQSGPESCSTKFGVWRDVSGAIVDNDGGGAGGAGYDPDCVSVPEPGSSALLAIGIFGMAFVAVRRRSLAELLNRA